MPLGNLLKNVIYLKWKIFQACMLFVDREWRLTTRQMESKHKNNIHQLLVTNQIITSFYSSSIRHGLNDTSYWI